MSDTSLDPKPLTPEELATLCGAQFMDGERINYWWPRLLATITTLRASLGGSGEAGGGGKTGKRSRSK